MKIFAIIIVLAFVMGFSLNNEMEIVELDPRSSEAVAAAKFAVKELSTLSDSNIYETLQLIEIIDAKQQDGIFHDNIIMEIELGSPYFKSKKLSEIFIIIVMTHKEDGAKSFAIDEFPVMDGDAIETFYIKKTIQTRKERDTSFIRLELESLLFEIDDKLNYKEKRQIKQYSTTDLIAKVDPQKASTIITNNSERLQHRMHPYYKNEEMELSNMSLLELYQIISGEKVVSEYQTGRAEELFNAVILHLNSEKED